MIPLYSKRNQVYAAVYQGRAAVEKHFADAGDWARENGLYMALEGMLPLPEVLHSEPGLIVTAYCPQPTLMAVLEKQERDGFSHRPWRALAEWIRRCHDLCGALPEDGNLRNFLWDLAGGTVIGLDLESFGPLTPDACGAGIAAALLGYSPTGTAVKKQAAGVLAAQLQIPDRAIQEERKRLLERRRGASSRPFSAVVLMGGRSRRMGKDKAGSILLGQTFLQRQVDKLKALGIEDIMVSGPGGSSIPDVRELEDELPQRGPLGGLYTCLRAARNRQCLVLSVDVPLVPGGALSHLCRRHRKGVTALRHRGKTEPLIAVYDSGVSQIIRPLIEDGGAPVRAMEGRIPWDFFDYTGPEDLLLNCNTPEDHVRLTATAGVYQVHGLPL